VDDLGADKIFIYRFNAQDGSLAPNNPPFANIAPGSGPRHLAFHPNGKWIYVISEIASTVTAFNWNPENGALEEFQTVSALPENFKGVNTSAEIAVHPNGKFLYASNRGDDSVAIFAIDQTTGKLTLVGHISCGGKTPRFFTFDPTGKWLLCSNHGSDNTVVFRVDEKTGKLTQTGQPVSVPYPFCERFLPVR
jgi:6-phosphogluconolactonase